jgi:enoyl-CoA hydratase/carnithine racemase
MPTIALINGHAFAGGLMLAMLHDYRIQNPAKGFLCLNEVHMGVPLQPPMTAIFRVKIPSAVTLRSLILEGKRFSAQEAVSVGLVDGLGGVDEVFKLIKDTNLMALAKSPAYQALKEDLYREILALLGDQKGNDGWREKVMSVDEELSREAQRKVDGFEGRTGKVKL